jgi:hypothetical protein
MDGVWYRLTEEDHAILDANWRREEISKAIEEARKEGLYEIAEHRTSQIDLDIEKKE